MSWFSRKTDPASTPSAAWSQWAAAEPQRTEPLSVERLERIFEHKSWYYRLDEDGDLTGRWDNEIFTFMLRGPDRDILNIMGYMCEDIPMSRLEEARFALEEWHHSHLWPTCFWRENEDAGLTFSVGASVAVDWEHGVTDDQLAQQIDCALSTCMQAFDDMRARLGLPTGITEDDGTA
ncbi:type III secretion system chaperone family protein [Actinomyces oricola]|uniref:YbjN domain-containing protein n=1 Tax=Actinomyces oricola TaxID=206043 RepID=UPI000FFE6D26|nr:YbjN domain-containing protein [Actinomyces oricola]